jgi:hypothetical protein
VKWRDVVLTVLAWAAFVLLLDAEFKLFLGDYIALLFSRPVDSESYWPMFIAGLMPFLLTAVALGAILVVFGLRTVLRRRRALLLPQPVPLDVSDEARRAGLDEATLIAARAERIVIVHFDADGSHRIEAAGGG